MKNHLSPHDRFFRSAMTNPRVVQEFFAANLPSNIKNMVDLATIKLTQDSFINDKLKLQITDLLFTVEFNHQSGYFYLLVEHQSSSQKLMPFRLLKYMIAIIEQHLKTFDTETLPLVYPMIFYNGRKSYHHSTALLDLFGEHKNLIKEIILNPFSLIDLTKISDKSFENYLYYGILARTMKHIFSKDYLPFIKELILDIKAIETDGAFDYIYSIFSYIIVAGEIVDKDEFHKIIKTDLGQVDKEQIMTLAEIYRKEGEQKGKYEGKQEGRQEALRLVIQALLQQKFTIEQIAKYINLSVTEVNRLKEQTH